jgi:hypothetical protein
MPVRKNNFGVILDGINYDQNKLFVNILPNGYSLNLNGQILTTLKRGNNILLSLNGGRTINSTKSSFKNQILNVISVMTLIASAENIQRNSFGALSRSSSLESGEIPLNELDGMQPIDFAEGGDENDVEVTSAVTTFVYPRRTRMGAFIIGGILALSTILGAVAYNTLPKYLPSSSVSNSTVLPQAPPSAVFNQRAPLGFSPAGPGFSDPNAYTIDLTKPAQEMYPGAYGGLLEDIAAGTRTRKLAAEKREYDEAWGALGPAIYQGAKFTGRTGMAGAKLAGQAGYAGYTGLMATERGLNQGVKVGLEHAAQIFRDVDDRMGQVNDLCYTRTQIRKTPFGLNKNSIRRIALTLGYYDASFLGKMCKFNEQYQDTIIKTQSGITKYIIGTFVSMLSFLWYFRSRLSAAQRYMYRNNYPRLEGPPPFEPQPPPSPEREIIQPLAEAPPAPLRPAPRGRSRRAPASSCVSDGTTNAFGKSTSVKSDIRYLLSL